MKAFTTAYLIPMPQLPPDPVNFLFNATVNGQSWSFTWKFINGLWRMWATLPDLSIREAGIFPNTISWTGFNDFGIVPVSPHDSIGQNDLGQISLYLLGW